MKSPPSIKIIYDSRQLKIPPPNALLRKSLHISLFPSHDESEAVERAQRRCHVLHSLTYQARNPRFFRRGKEPSPSLGFWWVFPNPRLELGFLMLCLVFSFLFCLNYRVIFPIRCYHEIGRSHLLVRFTMQRCVIFHRSGKIAGFIHMFQSRLVNSFTGFLVCSRIDRNWIRRNSCSNELQKKIILSGEEWRMGGGKGKGYKGSDVDTTLTFLGFELPGWWLGIHFPPPLYSFSICQVMKTLSTPPLDLKSSVLMCIW